MLVEGSETRTRPPRERAFAKQMDKVAKLCKAFLWTVTAKQRGVKLVSGHGISKFIRSCLEEGERLHEVVRGETLQGKEVVRLQYMYGKVDPTFVVEVKK